MSVFVVSYELKNETGSADYRPLWDALENLTSQKVQRSVWLVASTDSAANIHANLKQFMDEDDRLWVSKVQRGSYAYSGAIAGTKKFLADYL